MLLGKRKPPLRTGDSLVNPFEHQIHVRVHFLSKLFQFFHLLRGEHSSDPLGNLRPFHIEIRPDLRDARGLRANRLFVDRRSVDRFAQASTFLNVLHDEWLHGRPSFAQDGVNLLLLGFAHAQLGNFPEEKLAKRRWPGGIVRSDRPGDSNEAGERDGPGTR